MAVPSLKFISLYKKLKLRYPGKWYESSACNLLWNVTCVYPDFYTDYVVLDREISKIHSRRKRIRKYVRSMVENLGYNILCLVSLTFTDDVLSSTSFSTRKTYVRTYLNSISSDYFSCVDFGKKNGREHYHAIVSLNYSVPYFTFTKRRRVYLFPFDDCSVWGFGFSSFRPISFSSSDIYKTLNYAFKTSNYAFKCADSQFKPFHKRCGFADIPDGLF